MSDKKKSTQQSPANAPGSVRVGKEELSKVFRSDGGSELSSQHNTRITQPPTDSFGGPIIRHDIIDGEGPINSRQIDAPLPGPVLPHSLTDGDGPSEVRDLRDATGPVVARKKIQDNYPGQGKLDLTGTRLGHTRTATQAPADPASPAIRLETFSIHMEDRLASVKASQKETLEQMKQLEAEQQSEQQPPADLSDGADSKQRSPKTTLTDNTPMHANPNTALGKEVIYRHILPGSALHPAIRASVALNHRDIVEEVMQAITANAVVVIGMGGNPFVSRARTMLSHAGIAHRYLGYGNYLSQWRQRNALKMWSGWPTFPMIFIHGKLIGGYQDLKALNESGALTALLEA